MSTAQAFYELYKQLPKKAKKEIKQLIESEDGFSLVEEIRCGLKEIKAIKSGQARATSLEDFIKELENGH